MARCPFAQWDPIPGTTTGGSYTSGPFKIVHHTTEGDSYESARSAYGASNAPPHFTVDSMTIYQHIDTDRAARALRNPPRGVQTNRDSAIQIEVVAFAGWPKNQQTLAQVARLSRWIEETHDVPRVWPNGYPRPPRDGRDPGGHNRSATNWDRLGGHYGHSQVPENTHWDPAYTREEVEIVMTDGIPSPLDERETLSSISRGNFTGEGSARTAPPPALRLGQKAPNQSEAVTVGPFLGLVPRNSPTLVRNTNTEIVFSNNEGNDDDRFMTPRLKEKTDILARLVIEEWPGVKLRVTDAWDEGAGHGATSRHYEGRAVDLTTFPRDAVKLGRLARLAVEAGFDWVYYEDVLHIHASVKREENPHDLLAVPDDVGRLALEEEDRQPIVSELRAWVEKLEEEQGQLEVDGGLLATVDRQRLIKIRSDITSLEAAMVGLASVFRV